MLVIQEVTLGTGDEKLTAIGIFPTVGLLIATTPKHLLIIMSLDHDESMTFTYLDTDQRVVNRIPRSRIITDELAYISNKKHNKINNKNPLVYILLLLVVACSSSNG